MGRAVIRAIDYYLPADTLSNETLVERFPDWSAEKIEAKTGIRSRRISSQDELASDLAVKAAERLFSAGTCVAAEIDFVLLCTQSPDYLLPSTSCLVQERLGIPTNAGAFDFNLGCSGFVYGLSIAKGLVETDQAATVLLLTAETYTKCLDENDISVRAVFGDGAAATVVSSLSDGAAKSESYLGPFVFGTDGRGASKLILRQNSLREQIRSSSLLNEKLYMNGPDIFSFTLKQVPASVDALLHKANRSPEDIDLYVFHQANKFMLEHLRKKIAIPEDKFMYALEDCGNTVSATIPIALRRAVDEGRLRGGELVMVVGFGVGYSWSAALIRWPHSTTLGGRP